MKFLNKRKEKLQNFRQQAMERTKEEKLAIRRKAREKAKKWRRLIGAKHMVFGALVFGMVTGMLSYSGVLEEADHWISDSIYHIFAHRQSNSSIRMITIDEKTVKKYGEYQSWSRERTARLLEQLNQLRAPPAEYLVNDPPFFGFRRGRGELRAHKAAELGDDRPNHQRHLPGIFGEAHVERVPQEIAVRHRAPVDGGAGTVSGLPVCPHENRIGGRL